MLDSVVVKLLGRYKVLSLNVVLNLDFSVVFYTQPTAFEALTTAVLLNLLYNTEVYVCAYSSQAMMWLARGKVRWMLGDYSAL